MRMRLVLGPPCACQSKKIGIERNLTIKRDEADLSDHEIVNEHPFGDFWP